VLETVIAKVFDAAGADPRSHIGYDAPRQHGNVQSLRSGAGDPSESTQGTLGEWLDSRGRGIARANGERAVEIDHDQQRCASRHQGVDRGGDLGSR
jgi:hypothetical protein